ncbi:MAG: hypothetical protein JW384_03463 [Nitrosomonadaceae bacterium]|nr:hypothetical protein [Nitrosomonadaceae bacterium]
MHSLDIVDQSLIHMAQGGIYDQLAGGFHRYSVDDAWMIPHFEKMLYDNALLSKLYLHAYLLSDNPMYKRITVEVLDYILREMTDSTGGFYSTQDADSEGEEGKYYAWTIDELIEVIGAEDARLVAPYYSVLPYGSFEGKNVLNRFAVPVTILGQLGVSMKELEAAVDRAKVKLLDARSKRVPPPTDDKVLTGWNGLMLRSLAEAGAALDRPDYVAAATKNAEFLTSTMMDGKQVLRTYREGRAKLNGYLEDYAFLADGLLALYEATLDLKWYLKAQELVDEMVARFWDDTNGGFFDTAHDHETLISRPKDLSDNAIPSGNAVAAELLLRFARLTGRSDYEEKAAQTLRLVAGIAGPHASSFGHFLCVLDMYLAPSQEIAIIGAKDAPGTDALLGVIRTHFLPHHVLAFAKPDDFDAIEAIPLLEDRDAIDGKPTAYVCQNFACQLPTTDATQFAKQLGVVESLKFGV